MGSRVQWVQLVQQENRVCLDLRGLTDHRDPVDAPSWGPRDLLEREVRRGILDKLDLRASLVGREFKAETDRWDPEVCQARTARPVNRELLEPLEPQEPREPLEALVLRANKEKSGLRVLLEAKEREESEATSSPQRQSRPLPGRSASN